MQTDQEATPHVSGQPNSTLGMTHPREIERTCKHSVMPFPDVRYNMSLHPPVFRARESHYWICLQQGGITNFHYLCPLFQIHQPWQ